MMDDIDINNTVGYSNKKEMLELILQFFYENNYVKSAKLLESKANIAYEQNKMQQFKLSLFNHKFEESCDYIEQVITDQKVKNEALILIKSRIYFEMLLSNFTMPQQSSLNMNNALNYLRMSISQIVSKDQLKDYSKLLFSKTKKELEMQLMSQFRDIITDDMLISKIQSLLCLSVAPTGGQVLPDSRLVTLIKNYSNIQSQEKKIVFQQKLMIEKSQDEVWHLVFTKSQSHFATCARSGIVSVYSIKINQPNNVSISCISSFQAHKKYISSLAWSDNEKVLITTSNEKLIKVWNPFENGGKCLNTLQIHDNIVSTALFFTNGIIISGGIDKKLNFTSISSGYVTMTETFSRIAKILRSEALNSIIIIPASMNHIIIWDYKNNTTIGTIPELDPIISAAISKNDNGRFLISNVSNINANINLYNLQTRELINKYYGHRQELYMIDCSFAGENDEYIICGSEDATIFIWHRSCSIAISEIKGHTGPVNSSSLICGLEGLNGLLLFSVSDDHTLRVWSDNTNCSIEYNDTAKENKNTDIVVSNAMALFENDAMDEDDNEDNEDDNDDGNDDDDNEGGEVHHMEEDSD